MSHQEPEKATNVGAGSGAPVDKERFQGDGGGAAQRGSRSRDDEVPGVQHVSEVRLLSSTKVSAVPRADAASSMGRCQRYLSVLFHGPLTIMYR